MPCARSRRQFLKASTASAAAWLAAPPRIFGAAPATPVAVSKCDSYGPELVPALDRMFDQLGGLGRIVKGKTVAIKINLTGAPTYRVGYLPCEDTHYTHPRVIGAVCYLMHRAGANEVGILASVGGSKLDLPRLDRQLADAAEREEQPDPHDRRRR